MAEAFERVLLNVAYCDSTIEDEECLDDNDEKMDVDWDVHCENIETRSSPSNTPFIESGGKPTPTEQSLLVVVVALLNGADMTDFGCENSLITDEWREMILNFHNDKREIVAMGKQTDKSNKALPEAQQMFRMVWDCNVEMIAHEALTNCTAIPDTGLEVNGEGLDFREGIIPKKKDFNVLTETKQLLNAWYNEVRQSIIPDTLKWGPSYHNFSAIVRDDAKGMACTYTTACGDGMKMVCVYNAPYVMFPRVWRVRLEPESTAKKIQPKWCIIRERNNVQ
ncbi:hypothetical protein Y032_0847g2665 [Ancylostoma ceylanicum]|uniref:SCP domain-containing protein n=1 Tax=Ancylostoma ceylanicum TaxID=53326 RepID=A0A016WC48_9BILA|nr:hypothetical protein Y032_0847g2665 [Ancylostoma ceylanicum]